MVDIVVASPGRLMQHRQRGNVFFSNVNKIIIDEVDTMLTQGFGGDIRGILKNVFQRAERTNVDSGNGDGKWPIFRSSGCLCC
jgi:superfamily II DNA/RNA helicase